MDISSDFSLDGSSGSRLLSESPILPSSSSSSHADLSISELSLSDRPSPSRPFSLLAQPSTPTRTRQSDGNEGEDGENNDGEITQRQINVESESGSDTAEQREQDKRIKAKMRQDKLQNDLSVLRKLNAVFSSYNEALEEVGSANERISQQLAQTEALLNKYVGLLAKSEEFSRLIFDEEWEGSLEDDRIIQHEHEERIEQARREAEERQKEKERMEREAREKQEREEKERAERERKELLATRGGVRGVRGTRASTRAVNRGTVPSTRGSIGSRGTSNPTGLSRGASATRGPRGTVRRT